MKKLFLSIAIFGALLSVPKFSEAQRIDPISNSSELKLRLYDNSMFVVIFDRRIYDAPTSLFRLSNIKPGNHRLVIKKRHGRYGTESTVYNGNVRIPPRTIVKAKLSKYNRLEIRNENIGGGGYDDGHYQKPILDLHSLKNSMNHTGFESDKKRIAEQAISRNRVKANQVYQILMMFSFESSKIKVAKFAYRHCIDKRNYYIVNDAFTFSSSIRELDNYIGSFKSDYYDDDWEYYDNNNSNRYKRY